MKLMHIAQKREFQSFTICNFFLATATSQLQSFKSCFFAALQSLAEFSLFFTVYVEVLQSFSWQNAVIIMSIGWEVGEMAWHTERMFFQ